MMNPYRSAGWLAAAVAAALMTLAAAEAQAAGQREGSGTRPATTARKGTAKQAEKPPARSTQAKPAVTRGSGKTASSGKGEPAARSTARRGAGPAKARPAPARGTAAATLPEPVPTGPGLRVGEDITMVPNGRDSTGCQRYSMSSRGFGPVQASFYKTARGDFTTDRNEASCSG